MCVYVCMCARVSLICNSHHGMPHQFNLAILNMNTTHPLECFRSRNEKIFRNFPEIWLGLHAWQFSVWDLWPNLADRENTWGQDARGNKVQHDTKSCRYERRMRPKCVWDLPQHVADMKGAQGQNATKYICCGHACESTSIFLGHALTQPFDVATTFVPCNVELPLLQRVPNKVSLDLLHVFPQSFSIQNQNKSIEVFGIAKHKRMAPCSTIQK